MKSPQAQAAAQIRKMLKANNVPARVTSDGGSMTSSVNITLLDNPLPGTVKRVKEYAAQFQYGHFDGMNDIYEHSNSRDDIPQAKYVFVNTDYNDGFRQDVWTFVRGRLAGADELPESYNDAMTCDLQGNWVSNWVHRVLCGSVLEDFWTGQKVRVRA